MLPPPELPPLTEWVLREFESDDRVFREFVFGVHSFQVYSGDYAKLREQEADPDGVGGNARKHRQPYSETGNHDHSGWIHVRFVDRLGP